MNLLWRVRMIIPEIKYKQFVIVPKNPRMSKGKIASQVAHATFMALEQQRKTKKGKEIITKWKQSGMCVIVLECPTQVELMNIKTYCEQWDIQSHLYIDEGITEITMGTATAFATGVVEQEQFWIMSQLKLFKERWWEIFTE